ncbi:substrate-binding periplasmic protein [Spartinivicinus poritis]|uniref:Transporter substrate-binding domain-containing protein n=1 Tax=Spartinivicinus poritis TaxID=2994640 RepID=A0ABT5UH55_9GAMM|nr:transporter substrate-binding domain-containing protein [Spartinivicinus sp. A2-2]MDE1465729.1 transporter substrate-binding domain-containing protein [Spartinivicinus sp. A2-2]
MISPKNIRKLWVVVFFCIQCVLCRSIFAEKWTVVTHPNYPPYNYKDKSGQPAGLDTELVRAVLDHLKIDYKIVFVPWSRVVHMTEQNELDLAYQFKSKPERREKYLLVGPLRSGKTVFAVKKASKIKDYNGLAGLQAYSVGMNLGYSYGTAFDDARQIKKTAVKTNEQLIEMLVLGRVEIIIGDLHTLTFAAKQMGKYNDIRFLPSIYQEFDRYVAVPKNRAANAGWFDHGLNTLRETGEYDKIMDKWR